jgi:16S rRNA (cytidine1402-2'-O)-methyltransferase
MNLIMTSSGCLYVVATPIGNPRDITLRALDVLRQVDGVICEEQRQGSTLLKRLGITNQLILLNEHNEDTQAIEVVMRLQNGQRLALVSDCGTPVFADPGLTLINMLAETNIPVIPVPGPSSLTAALSICDFDLRQFIFAGFLPPKEDRRRAELERLRSLNQVLVLMDTPYRLTPLLQDVALIFGRRVHINLACDLTLPSERIYRGAVEDVLVQTNGKKAEFILLVNAVSRGRASHPDIGGRASHPDIGGRASHPDIGGRASHPDIGGRASHPDIGGRRT